MIVLSAIIVFAVLAFFALIIAGALRTGWQEGKMRRELHDRLK